MTVMCHWVGWLLESGNVSTMIDRMRMDMEREKKNTEGKKGERGGEKRIHCVWKVQVQGGFMRRKDED